MKEYGSRNRQHRKVKILSAIAVAVLLAAGAVFATRSMSAKANNKVMESPGNGSDSRPQLGFQTSGVPERPTAGSATPPFGNGSVPPSGNQVSQSSPGKVPNEVFSQQFRDTSLYPPPSHLASLQAQAASGARPDLKDPRRVAEEYLKVLYRGTVAAQRNEFGLGEYEKSASGNSDDAGPVHFTGAHEVAAGRISVRRYNWPEGQPNDIWYVVAASSELIGQPGEALGDKFRGKIFRRFLIPRASGTMHVLIKPVAGATPVVDETFQLAENAYFKIERTFNEIYASVSIRAELRSTNGKLGIVETDIPNE